MNEKIKTTIMSLYRQSYGIEPYQTWPKDLFDMKNPHQEIVRYIHNRFKTTTDEVEFYTAMIFLVHEVPDKELFISYQESPQHLKILGDKIIKHKSSDKHKHTDNKYAGKVPRIDIINTIQTIKPIGE